MNKPYFEFKKYRSFDQIIEGGFKFLRLNFKQMIGIIWKQNAVYLMAFLVAVFLFYYYFNNFYFSVLSNNTESIDEMIQSVSVSGFVGILAFVVIASIVFSVRYYAGIFGYIKSYIDNKGKVDEQFIAEYTKQKFWGFIGLVIISAIILFIATLFLIIPAIWLSVPITIATAAFFLDNFSITDAITKSMDFVKEKWWFSLGVIIVTAIIISLLQFVFNAPATIYTMIKAIAAVKIDPNKIQTAMANDPIMVIFNVFTIIGKYLLTMLNIAILSVLYYSLKEYHTAEGSLSKIDSIGENRNN